MAFSILDGAMAFGNGVIEADKKNTKENLLIRGEELKAKRDAIIAMKKSKYEYDLNNYDKNKSKYDGLTSVSSNYNTGKYNIKEGEAGFVEGQNSVDNYKFGEAFLTAKHGQDWMIKERASRTVDGVSTDWINYVKNVGANVDLKKSISNIDFKTRNTMESNYLESLDKIESKYSSMLKNAKNDSSLVNAILGKKKEEISNLTIDMADDKKTITTIDSASPKENNEIVSTETETTESTDAPIESLTSTNSDALKLTRVSTVTDAQMSITFKKEATTQITKAKDYKYSDKEPSAAFSSWVLRNVPEASTKKYFSENTKGELIAKEPIIDAQKTVNSLLKNSAFDLTKENVFSIANGKTENIANATSFNAREILAEKHIEQYGNWFVDGQVLGKDGSVKNLLKKESNVFTVPSQSVIDMNTNTLKGFNIIIPNNEQEIPADLINTYTGLNTEEAMNMNTRKYVGMVYMKALEDQAKLKQARDGGELEEQMNNIQNSLQNDNGGNDKFTKEIRKTIANSLGISSNTETTETTSDKTVNESNINKPNMRTVSGEIKPINVNIDGKSYDLNNPEILKEMKKSKDGLELISSTAPYLLSRQENDIATNTISGDGSVAEQVADVTNKKKITPVDVGDKSGKNYFETLSSIKAILPNDMSGAEIKRKYNIDFSLNNKTIYKPNR